MVLNRAGMGLGGGYAVGIFSNGEGINPRLWSGRVLGCRLNPGGQGVTEF